MTKAPLQGLYILCYFECLFSRMVLVQRAWETYCKPAIDKALVPYAYLHKACYLPAYAQAEWRGLETISLCA